MEANLKQLVTIAHLQDFKDELLAQIGELLKGNKVTSNKKWLKTKEVMKFLEVSAGTLQTMRNSGTIVFTKIGGSLYYDPDDIQEMM